MTTKLPAQTNIKEWTNMPPISEELYDELVKEFNNERKYFFNDSYTLDEEMLEELLTTSKEELKD